MVPVQQAPQPQLDPNQARHLLSVFRHLDELLGSVAEVTHQDTSAFATIRLDLASHEAMLLRSAVAAARAEVARALTHFGLPAPVPHISARWSAQTSLGFAEVALADLDPASMRGYGALEDSAAEHLRTVTEYLRILVRRAGALLHEEDSGGLTDRLTRIPGTAGLILRELERLITGHPLSEVRPLLAAAVERAEANGLQLGVFGRVSSGKSSLLNALAGQPVLPVGATPVTAVPVHIRRGRFAIRVIAEDGASRALALDAIATVVTEAANPGNRLGVRRVEIEVPDLPDGLTLLDTPGVGSLNTSGPALAFASLPRCDLGLVLIPAGSPVTPDEVALVAGLRHAGIRCQILLSKCDLLSVDEVTSSLAYVERELAGIAPAGGTPVRPVSTAPGFDGTVASLQGELIQPLLADRAIAVQAALVARLRRLLVAVDSALAGRGPSDERQYSPAKAVVAARDRLREVTDGLLTGAPRILDQAADAVLHAWRSGEDGTAAVVGELLRVTGEALGEIRQATDHREPDSAGTTRLPPVFDPAFLGRLPDLSVPRLKVDAWLRAQARHRLAPLGPPMADALTRFSARLSAWGEARLEGLARLDTIEAPDAAALADPALRRLADLLDGVG
jgi:hypothetical protein